MPQSTACFPNEVGVCCSDGGGYIMDRMVGWASNGRNSAAPLFGCQANLAMGQALSANLFRSSWVVRWILILRPMDCVANWKSLLTGSARATGERTIIAAWSYHEPTQAISGVNSAQPLRAGIDLD